MLTKCGILIRLILLIVINRNCKKQLKTFIGSINNQSWIYESWFFSFSNSQTEKKLGKTRFVVWLFDLMSSLNDRLFENKDTHFCEKFMIRSSRIKCLIWWTGFNWKKQISWVELFLIWIWRPTFGNLKICWLSLFK